MMMIISKYQIKRMIMIKVKLEENLMILKSKGRITKNKMTFQDLIVI